MRSVGRPCSSIAAMTQISQNWFVFFPNLGEIKSGTGISGSFSGCWAAPLPKIDKAPCLTKPLASTPELWFSLAASPAPIHRPLALLWRAFLAATPSSPKVRHISSKVAP